MLIKDQVRKHILALLYDEELPRKKILYTLIRAGYSRVTAEITLKNMYKEGVVDRREDGRSHVYFLKDN